MMRTTKSFDKLNRLTGVTSIDAQSALLSSFSYVGRRISKKVWSNAEGTGSPDVDLRFAYDNWNLIAVLGPDFSPILSFTWGTDLSGTLQGAGGVGGLLSVTMHTGLSAGTYFCCYDGNGNVTALVSAVDASVAARYEYGPFGEVLRADGPACAINPFRFSTKYQDEETDLLYYGYRYYNASTGRWLSRDPLGEFGGFNTYVLVENVPANKSDLLGLVDYIIYTGTRSPSSFNNISGGGPHTVSELTPAVLLSVKDNYGLPVTSLDETDFFTKPGNARYAAATERSKQWFSSEIGKKVCGFKKGYNIPAYKVKPDSDDAEVGNYRLRMSDWERAYVIGSYEYRVTQLHAQRQGQYGEIVAWRAEVTIVDTLGWDGNKFPLFPQWIDKTLQKLLFGKPGRHFARGVFWISGEVDCCQLAAHLHR